MNECLGTIGQPHKRNFTIFAAFSVRLISIRIPAKGRLSPVRSLNASERINNVECRFCCENLAGDSVRAISSKIACQRVTVTPIVTAAETKRLNSARTQSVISGQVWNLEFASPSSEELVNVRFRH